jgi:hypothetical protein
MKYSIVTIGNNAVLHARNKRGDSKCSNHTHTHTKVTMGYI